MNHPLPAARPDGSFLPDRTNHSGSADHLCEIGHLREIGRTAGSLPPGVDSRWIRINCLLTLPPPRNMWLVMRHGFSEGNARQWTCTSRRAVHREGLFPGERPELVAATRAIQDHCTRFALARGVTPRVVVLEGLFRRHRESTDALLTAGLSYHERVPSAALRERYFGDMEMPRLNKIFTDRLIAADRSNPFEKHFGFEAVAGVVGRVTRVIARYERDPHYNNCLFLLSTSHDAAQIALAASGSRVPHPGWYTSLPSVKNGEVLELSWSSHLRP